MDYFDLTGGSGELEEALAPAQCAFQVLSFSSDWLYPSYQSQEMVRALQTVGRDVSYTEIQAANYGHDSFLLDVAEQPEIVCGILARMERNCGEGAVGQGGMA